MEKNQEFEEKAADRGVSDEETRLVDGLGASPVREDYVRTVVLDKGIRRFRA